MGDVHDLGRGRFAGTGAMTRSCQGRGVQAPNRPLGEVEVGRKLLAILFLVDLELVGKWYQLDVVALPVVGLNGRNEDGPLGMCVRLLRSHHTQPQGPNYRNVTA